MRMCSCLSGYSDSCAGIAGNCVDRLNPAAVAVNTSSSLVWFVTAIDRPVVVPEDIVPIAITPVIAGASVTTAPGTAVKELFGAVD